ncbi:hypothetical protein Xoosp13_131 [Xanthomonas phage Xoo-sp13]|nr:hypothetical protein Xoosp13_131 [Xanthomonas phage Xoo-sp13]
MSFSEMLDVFHTIYINSWWLMLIIFFSVVVGMTVSNINKYKHRGYYPGEEADDMFESVMFAVLLAGLWPLSLAICSGIGIWQLVDMLVSKIKSTK